MFAGCTSGVYLIVVRLLKFSIACMCHQHYPTVDELLYLKCPVLVCFDTLTPVIITILLSTLHYIKFVIVT